MTKQEHRNLTYGVLSLEEALRQTRRSWPCRPGENAASLATSHMPCGRQQDPVLAAELSLRGLQNRRLPATLSPDRDRSLVRTSDPGQKWHGPATGESEAPAAP